MARNFVLLMQARRTLAILLVAMLVSACVSKPPLVRSRSSEQARQPSGSEIINPTRGTRGNPKEYEVFGRKYQPMNSSDGYRDTGVASWYGRDFHGKPTSSGEPYDMYILTAAHKTLPLPTWVEVTNQRNGKSVIVKVNDRGPFVDDRIIDLSYAAAIEIDMVRDGTAPVFIRALGAPATLPNSSSVNRNAQPVSAVPARSSTSPATEANLDVAGSGSESSNSSVTSNQLLTALLYVQVGAFGDYRNAERMLERLETEGFSGALVATERAGDQQIHRVRIGPQDSRVRSESARDELRRRGFSDAQIVTIR